MVKFCLHYSQTSMKNADEIKLKVSATASYSKSTMNVSCSQARGMGAIQIREPARKEMSKIEKQVAKMLLKKQFLVLTTPIKKHLFQVYTNKFQKYLYIYFAVDVNFKLAIIRLPNSILNLSILPNSQKNIITFDGNQNS